MSYKKSFHDVSREINEEPNARVNRTNTWWFKGDRLELRASVFMEERVKCILQFIFLLEGYIVREMDRRIENLFAGEVHIYESDFLISRRKG